MSEGYTFDKTTCFTSTIFCTSYKIIIRFTKVANWHKPTIFCLLLVIFYVTVWQYSADPIALCMCKSSRDKILHGCTCISQNQNNEDDEIWLKLAHFLLQKLYEINWKYGLFVFFSKIYVFQSRAHSFVWLTAFLSWKLVYSRKLCDGRQTKVWS